MTNLPFSIESAIEAFKSLPGIGPKTAGRLTFYLLTLPEERIQEIARALDNLKKGLKVCSLCFNFAEDDPCKICSASSRDRSLLAVVAEPLDVLALERAGFNGLYHVLGGLISPLEGLGPEDIRIEQLIKRLKDSIEGSRTSQFKEVILATNPSLEGEATAMYIYQKLKPSKVQITRLARGLPVGSDLEYADEVTLNRALEGRKEF